MYVCSMSTQMDSISSVLVTVWPGSNCVKSRLEDLHRIEGVLEGLIRLCGASSGKVRCPLIAALKTDASLSA